MLSLFSEATSLVISVLVLVLKSIFQLITFYLKMLWNLLRLLIAVLPVTGVFFALLYVVYIVQAATGYNLVPSQIPLQIDASTFPEIFNALKIWWYSIDMQYKGNAVIYVFYCTSALLFLPVIMTIIAFVTVSSSLYYLGITLLIDMVWYVLCMLFMRELPTSQIANRYYVLFPSAGTKHYERQYEKWLRRHHDDFDDEEDDDYDYDLEDEYERDTRRRRRRRRQDFYDDHIDYDDDYYDDYPEEYDEDDYPEEYDDDYPEDELDDSEEYNDYYEDEDDRIEDKSRKRRYYEQPDNISSFDFFAGCKSIDSLNKKYKTLVKLYHPDNSDGDTSALQEINIQYTEAKKKLKSS